MALDGRSVTLDPMTHAVRADLADVRLADRVFAPHYASPVPRTIARGVSLRQARGDDSPVIATLVPGAAFDLLDVVGGDAWGIAVAETLVGYVDADALGEPEDGR